MTQQEAYVNGFCKTAEALGYDPNFLYKRAANKGKLLTTLLSPFQRFGERLTGKSLKPLQAAVNKNKRSLKLLAGNADPSAAALGKKTTAALTRSEKALQNEIMKVNLTRGLTGGGLAGLAIGGLAGGGDDKPQYPYPRRILG